VLSYPVRSSIFALAATLSLSSFVSGCSESADSPAPEAESTQAVKNEVTVPISAVTVALVDPGDGPHEVLAPHPAMGATQQVTLRTTNRIRQQINNQADQELSSPALTIPLTAAADEHGARLTIGKVTTPDAKLSGGLGPAEGSHAGFTVNPRGAITSLRLSPPADATDAVRSAIEQAFYQAVYSAVVFPDEPIGVGAVWTMQQQVSGGVTLDQITTARLAERDGNRVVVTVDVMQKPKSEIWNLPNDAGMLTVEDFVMKGSGTVTMDLGLPLPVDGLISLGGDQTYADPETLTRLKQSTGSTVQWGG
jgi:hypothetical protein